jgi:hypothetical protein
MMRYSFLKRLSKIALGSVILLQLASCADVSQALVTASSVVTAGGLIFLIRKVTG